MAFYDDDPKLYFSSSARKHVSLNLLLERSGSLELPVSRTFLVNALRIAAISKDLPRSATFHRLPATHRIELLPLKTAANIERFASKAMASKLTVRKLRELIHEESQPGVLDLGRGRKRVPAILRKIEQCLRILQDEGTGKLAARRSEVTQLTAPQIERAQSGLASLEKCVTELRRLFG